MVHWYDPSLQTKTPFIAGDTILAVPGKSGTTWTMNIFHQLRTGGDADFADIYAEVPWPELRERPDQPDEELVERWANMPAPRAFKTHSQPGDGPGDFATFRNDLKYVVVFRNPEEAIVSFKPFLEAQSLKMWELFNASELRKEFVKPTFKEFFEELVLKGFPGMPAEAVPPGGMLTMFYFGFINGWWEHRHKSNVLFMHFSDMKRDHEGSVRKIAKHLGFEPTAEQWPKVLEYTSFKWMKEHEDKFEVATLCKDKNGEPFKLINDGGMVRKGKAGAAAEDGMTPEIAAVIMEWAEKMVPDDEARRWMYEGGEIAPPAPAVAKRVGEADVKVSPRSVVEEKQEAAA